VVARALAAIVAVVLCRLVPAAWPCGFLAPPQTSADAPPPLFDVDRFAVEERSRTLTVTVTRDDVVIDVRQVFFNVGRRTQEFVWILPMPNGAVLQAATPGLTSMGSDEALAWALDCATTHRYPHLLGCLDGVLLRSSTISIGPHRPWVAAATYRVPALRLGDERFFVVPLARRGPHGPPIRRTHLSLRTVGGLADRLVCLSHEVTPPLPRSRWSYMAITAEDAIPEEDVLLWLTSDIRSGRVSLAGFVDDDGTWIRAHLPLPAVDAATTRRRNPMAALFVVDVSGSLHGERLQAIRDGVLACLDALPEGSHFNIVPFALIPRSMHHEFLPVTNETREEARTYLVSLEGRGGTNLGETIQQAAELMAAAPPGHARRMYLLIDGKADVGIIDPERLASLYRLQMPHDTRLDVVALGSNVDVRLLATMAACHGGRLEVADEPARAKDVLVRCFETTLPRYPVLATTVQSGGLPIDFCTNAVEASHQDVPLTVAAHLPPGGAPSIELTVNARSAGGAAHAAAITTYTASIDVPFDAVGEAVRVAFVTPTVASLLGGVDATTELPTLPSWHEARVRRILQIPSGGAEGPRLVELARSSGPEVRARHGMIRQLALDGTFLPRPYLSLGLVFRRVGGRIFSRRPDGAWQEEPASKDEPTLVLPYGSEPWLATVRNRLELRGVLALGQHVRFRDGTKLVAVAPPR